MDAASVQFDDIADYGDADDSSELVPDEVSVTNNSTVGTNIPAEAVDKIPNIRSGPFVSLPNQQPPTDEDIPMPAVSTRSKTARLQQEFLSSDIRSSPAPSSSPPALVEGTHDSNSNSPNRSGSNSSTMQDANDEENQRDIPVVVAGFGQPFPAPREFDDLDTHSTDRTTLRTLGRAPWFEMGAVLAAGDHMERYADENGYLPGMIHTDCLQSWTWQRAFAVRDRDLSIR